MSTEKHPTPPILRLPNELLQPILEHVCEDVDPGFWDEPDVVRVWLQEAYRLNLVCKRFHELALPILYRNPAGRMLLSLASNKMNHLTRTLDEGPALRAMVKEMRLDWQAVDWAAEDWKTEDDPEDSEAEDSPDFVSMALSFLSKMTSLKKLKVLGDFDVGAFYASFLESVSELRDLEELELFCVPLRWEPSVDQFIMFLAAFPSLKELRIERMDVGDDLAKLLERTFEGVGVLTSLYIKTPKCGALEFIKFLAWPRALEHFHYENYDMSESEIPEAPLGTNVFSTALRSQRDSLKTVRFCYLVTNTYRGGECLNLVDFLNLETLQMHWNDVDCHRADVAAAKLLAPKLHTVIFDVRLTRFDQGIFESLNRDAGPWLACFAECAHAQHSALKEIKVNIFANVFGGVSHGSLDIESINNCLDNLEDARRQADRLGIKISYENGPSREDYQA